MAHQQESFLPFFSWQSLSCCLSCVAKRSTPKPRGPLPFPSELHGPLYLLQILVALSLLLQNHMALFLSPQNLMVLSSLHQSCLILSLLLQNLVILPFTPEPCGPLFIYLRTTWPSSFPLRTSWFSPSMPAAPRFKSQCPSSFAAPFVTPPTVSYTCQHPRILPALLGCHSKSGEVWPHGMEPIISKLSRRPCNQGELLPSPILGEFGPISLAHSMAAAI